MSLTKSLTVVAAALAVHGTSWARAAPAAAVVGGRNGHAIVAGPRGVRIEPLN